MESVTSIKEQQNRNIYKATVSPEIMGKTIENPTSNEVAAVKTMRLSDSNNNLLIFNAQRVGPMNFAGLRQTNYGLGFRMPTMSELIPLVHASLKNQDYETAKKVISTLRNYRLIGNTGILYIPKGMFVQDNPALENRRISMNKKTLESMLGKHQESGVVFSDSGSVRFVPYGFERESQSPLELSRNPGVIALVGGEKNAETLARASDLYKVNPGLFVLNKTNFPKTRIAGLCSSGEYDEELVISASLREEGGDGHSFGVWDGKTEDVSVEEQVTSLM